MKWLILGALLGLLLTIPQTLSALTTAVTALAPSPMLLAFVLGAAARPHLPVAGRRTR